MKTHTKRLPFLLRIFRPIYRIAATLERANELKEMELRADGVLPDYDESIDEMPEAGEWTEADRWREAMEGTQPSEDKWRDLWTRDRRNK